MTTFGWSIIKLLSTKNIVHCYILLEQISILVLQQKIINFLYLETKNLKVISMLQWIVDEPLKEMHSQIDSNTTKAKLAAIKVGSHSVEMQPGCGGR